MRQEYRTEVKDAFSYIAYGLGIRSALPLPELIADQRAADIFVRLRSLDNVPSEAKKEGYFSPTPQEAYLFWGGVGAFLVREGREIVVDPAPEADEQVFRPYITGPVLAVLLRQRGFLILHASAVAVDGQVVAFMGSKGWGKSTAAAALHARGYPLVADDVMAVRVASDTSCPVAFPAFPQLKLWPEAAAAVGEDPEALPRLFPAVEKRTRRAERGFSTQAPLPLRRIYALGVLADGADPKIEPLGLQQALVELVRHTFGAEALIGVGEPQHFFQCASVVNNVAVRRLQRPWSLSKLSQVVRLVEEDLDHAGRN